jgi:hypothetical protein
MALYAFDGTWNDSTAPDGQRDLKLDTNVHRFRQLYPGKAEYVEGVGCRFGFLGKLVGGFTGAGTGSRIRELFENLKTNFANGDRTIDVVGYSRGAATARLFLHHIEQSFDELLVEGKALTSPPPVRFLGLFDTVASFDLPWTEKERGFSPHIPEFVEHTFHAMALDESRETFGIERCLGNPRKITEVWFRGGHADIGGNATYHNHDTETDNRKRSNLALEWMLAKARACGIAMLKEPDSAVSTEAPVTAKSEPIRIGQAGTLSRRIHIGDLVHYSLDETDLTRGIDGRQLRRIDIPTRLEDEYLEQKAEPQVWIPPAIPFEPAAGSRSGVSWPSLVELSSRRNPFDIPPARTWKAWLKIYKIAEDQLTLDRDRLWEFWAPSDADRALAWDLFVELQTRIATQELKDDEGVSKVALESIHHLFKATREFAHRHGVGSVHTATLINLFLNQKIRPFTSKWHLVSQKEDWEHKHHDPQPEFRQELRALKPILAELCRALAVIADVHPLQKT